MTPNKESGDFPPEVATFLILSMRYLMRSNLYARNYVVILYIRLDSMCSFDYAGISEYVVVDVANLTYRTSQAYFQPAKTYTPHVLSLGLLQKWVSSDEV